MNPTRFRHLCFVLLLPLLGSCGGGGGSSANSSSTAKPSPTATVINGITVPIEPDATANAATLKGVDANNNGVRDDVERAVYTNSLDRKIAEAQMTLAKAKQGDILGTKNVSDEEYKAAVCTLYKNGQFEYAETSIVNTAEREKADSNRTIFRETPLCN